MPGPQVQRLFELLLDLVQHRLLFVDRAANVAGVVEQAVQAQPIGGVDMLGQGQRVLRALDTGAVEADIQIDQDADGTARLPGSTGQCIRRILRVDGNPQVDLVGQSCGRRGSSWIERRIPHQHVVGYPSHDLGLAQLRHGEAFGSPFHLQRPQARRFVGLGVGPQLHAVPAQVLNQAPRVAGCLWQIDHHRRCRDVLFLHDIGLSPANWKRGILSIAY